MNIRKTSEKTINYNCFAWAAGASRQGEWWEPTPDGYWPHTVPREQTLTAYIAAYETIGYEITQTSYFEEGFEKIAIYVNEIGQPKHASRQLPNGKWTSKLGIHEDVEHEFSDRFIGTFRNEEIDYGQSAVIMKRVSNNHIAID